MTIQIPLHYFKRFVEEIMPDLTAEDLDKKMETTINNLKLAKMTKEDKQRVIGKVVY
jgi:hypothetical protein